MDSTIRDQILAHLKSNRSATVAEMAKYLSVTKADIRYHLKTLIQERLVKVAAPAEHSYKQARGRPAARFTLAENARDDNYPQLAAALLRLCLGRPNRDPLETATQLANMIVRMPDGKSGSPIERLNRLIKELNDKSYDAHWEAHRDGPVVFFENCPYLAILSDFPLLCEMDRQILSEGSGFQADQIQQIDSSSRFPPACLFRLKK